MQVPRVMKFFIRSIFSTALLMGCCLAGFTQEADVLSFLRRIDMKMYDSQHSAKVDTAYIHIPDERWTIKTSADLTANNIAVSHFDRDVGYISHLSSAPSYSQGITVAWRWFEFGIGVNPSWFFPKIRNNDQSYSISVYGNRMGLSATMRYADTFRGFSMTLPDSSLVKIPVGVCKDLSGDFDAYYVFNAEKYSYPAAFSMMQVQKRSAGSAIASVSVRNAVTTFDPEVLKPGYDGENVPVSPGPQSGDISIADIAIAALRGEVEAGKSTLYTNVLALGGGYAYNFVTKNDWLIHASAMANLSLLSYNMMKTETDKYMLRRTFPDWVGSFQVSVIHWKGSWFYGANVIARGSVIGKITNLNFSNYRTEGHFVVGVRL